MSSDFIPSLKEGFLFRPATQTDIPAMADLFNLHWEPLLGVRKTTSADLGVTMNMPGFSMADSVRLIQSPQGQLVGVISVVDLDNPPIRLHFYDIPPMLSLLITNHYVFEEAYHFGRPDGVFGCIGGHVPMMKIRNQPELETRNPYAFYKAHFEYLYNNTRNKRVTLPIQIMDAKASGWVAFVNRMDKDIPMTGWQLSGQGGRRPYSFSSGFTWHAGEKIVIAQDQEDLPGYGEVLEADFDFLGDNTILRLTNAAGTLVGEWSMPQSQQDGGGKRN